LDKSFGRPEALTISTLKVIDFPRRSSGSSGIRSSGGSSSPVSSVGKYLTASYPRIPLEPSLERIFASISFSTR
jgi:hypothetical protein